MDNIPQQPLYGGALTLKIPGTFIDISDFREVPSHQEVFANVDTDQSIIVEILELANDATDDQCAQFHFRQLAEDNDAEDSQVSQVKRVPNADLPQWPADAKIYLLDGQQRVAKFNEAKTRPTASTTTTTTTTTTATGQGRSQDPHNLVEIRMAVIRLPHVTTDMVLTYNAPLVISDASSSKQVSHSHEGSVHEADQLFHILVQSLRVVNWNLFG
ncbi:hypothetical protein DFQ27_000854 [Actinomortierella ambigua]|uniref:Ran guanine nucleotide release factor n=1 Tax=Actinomortierella ambigua TaxID=1343610 RepID=A0A9P6QCW2_9FUNG|nr:hypothetical protein DFQ27_000854 [Actinomortierella ambigua]